MILTRAFCTAFLLLAISQSENGLGPPSFCDPRYTSSPGDALGYYSRPGRCEGRYRDRNAGEPFRIVSYISGPRSFSPASSTHVRLSWAAVPLTDSVRIEGISLDGYLAYRMDTRMAAPQHQFMWPMDVLNELGLTGDSIGLTVWAISRAGTRRDSALLPLRVNGSRYWSKPRLVVQSFRQVRNVQLTVRDAETRSVIIPAAVQLRVAPGNGEPFEIEIPDSLRSGRYYVEISATQVDRRPATDDAIILLPPPETR